MLQSRARQEVEIAVSSKVLLSDVLLLLSPIHEIGCLDRDTVDCPVCPVMCKDIVKCVVCSVLSVQ